MQWLSVHVSYWPRHKSTQSKAGPGFVDRCQWCCVFQRLIGKFMSYFEVIYRRTALTVLMAFVKKWNHFCGRKHWTQSCCAHWVQTITSSDFLKPLMHLTAASAWKGKHHRIIGNKHFLGHKKGIISPSVFAENKSIAKSLYAFI